MNTNERPLVGLLRVPAASDVQKMFEYAGRGETWDLYEAEIPIYKVSDYFFVGEQPGTRKDSWFQSRIGAVLGSDNRDTTPVRGVYPLQYDAFYLGRLWRKGKLSLCQGWKARPVGLYSTGETMFAIEKEDR